MKNMKNYSSMLVNLSPILATLFIALHISPVAAFVPSNPITSKSLLNAGKNVNDLTKEAVEIYFTKFPPKDEYVPPFFIKWGMPKYDIDGTPTSSRRASQIKSPLPKRVSDVDEASVRSTFRKLSAVYEPERAIEMARSTPICLAFDGKYFQSTFRELANIFGAEETKEMVLRNPGLLALRPKEAKKCDEQTMRFSYVVAATRPFGDVLLYGLLGLLMLPVLEGVTGVPFRYNLLQSIMAGN